MSFENLQELGSNLSNGFLMGDIVSLLQKEEYTIDDPEDFILLDNVTHYFVLAKQDI